MNNRLRALMLSVVIFALTSAPAPVDRTEGLGGVVAEVVLGTPVSAQQTSPQSQHGFALRGVTGGLIFGTRREGGRVTVEVYRIDG
jgi:hypothetical protein